MRGGEERGVREGGEGRGGEERRGEGVEGPVNPPAVPLLPQWVCYTI